MTLRTRLLIAYGYLVLLVIAVAGTATAGFFDLGGRIQTVLDKNVQSLEATTDLMETLERQDSATLSALLKARADTSDLDRANDEFRAALADSKATATDDAERDIVARIERDYAEYRDAREALLSEKQLSKKIHRPLAAYEARVFPKFEAVKTDVQKLLEHNQEAIVEADRQSQSRSTQYGAAMAALVAVGLLSFLVLRRSLQRRLLDRLAEIEDVADAVASGNLKRRFRVDIHDELGTAGEQLNQTLDEYAELERHVDGRLAEMKQNILGLFDSFDVEGAFFNADGRLVASTIDFSAPELPEGARETISAAGQKLVAKRDEAKTTTVELADGTHFELRLAYARGKRLVGWMARPSDDE